MVREAIWSLIREAADEHRADPPEDVAAGLLPGLTVEDLLPLLVRAVADAQRAVVRSVEVAAFERFRRDHPVPDKLPEVAFPPKSFIPRSVEELRPLLNMPIALGDGRRVLVGRATVEELLQRRAMIMAHVAGEMEEVRRIDELVAVLKETGAPCLVELLGEAA